MLKTIKIITSELDRWGIHYVVGGESLVGLIEGDYTKYKFNPILYVYPINPIKYIILAFSLLTKRITIKPKFNKRRIWYKARHKSSFQNQSINYLILLSAKRVNEKIAIFSGGRFIFFLLEDLNFNIPDYQLIDNLRLKVPSDPKNFITKYRNELFAESYRNYSIKFDENTEKSAVVLLKEVVAIINEKKMKYWLEGGTLLGAVRDKKLIEWDHDIDLGIKYTTDADIEDLIRKLKTTFSITIKTFPKKNGVWDLGKYRVINIYPRKFGLIREKLCLDLFIFYKEPLNGIEAHHVYKYVVQERNGYHDENFFSPLMNIEFYDTIFSIPNNVHKFLENKYGSDWRTPIKKWHVAIDDKSIIRQNNNIQTT